MDQPAQAPQTPESNLYFIIQKLGEQDLKLEKISSSVNSIKRYFLFTILVSILVIVVPMIGLVFLIPKLMSSFSSGGLTLPSGTNSLNLPSELNDLYNLK